MENIGVHVLRRTKANGVKAMARTGMTVMLVLASPGCEKPPMGMLGRRTIQFEGMERGCLIYVPHKRSAHPPLVFNLHGYGSYAAMQMQYTGMNAVADTAGFIVAYPNAVEHRWNSGIADNPPWPTPPVEDVGFIGALIDTLAAEFSLDLDRVYVCGMSNGGFMSYRLACRLADRIAGAASVTGVLSQSTAKECEPNRAIPFLHIHGTADSTVPYDGAPGWYGAEESIRVWAELHRSLSVDTLNLRDSNPSDGCRAVRIDYVDSSGQVGAVFYRVNGGGHTWPGSTFDLPGAGTTCRDLNASEEIWRFFAQQRKLIVPSAGR